MLCIPTSFYLQGNYVIQQVLVYGNEEHLTAILMTLTENDALLAYSKHKYASNVIEAILENGKPNHKGEILKEMLKVCVILYSKTNHCLCTFRLP